MGTRTRLNRTLRTRSGFYQCLRRGAAAARADFLRPAPPLLRAPIVRVWPGIARLRVLRLRRVRDLSPVRGLPGLLAFPARGGEEAPKAQTHAEPVVSRFPGLVTRRSGTHAAAAATAYARSSHRLRSFPRSKRGWDGRDAGVGARRRGRERGRGTPRSGARRIPRSVVPRRGVDAERRRASPHSSFGKTEEGGKERKLEATSRHEHAAAAAAYVPSLEAKEEATLSVLVLPCY
ncbi:hypothetical protein B0H17DRAFT_1061566 [Mycena rosella]|uniref:Uncharacterized protein n=1 Tax=Mycena rosella TaxID=1033263 RepID=A0AAD7DLB0_MYCRO|nr:hypothetical protein B0H17DRAFT_1061566 [Mycena rosella]